jgi:ABC-type Mn2+/Zn2+ transport system ATPase subunit
MSKYLLSYEDASLGYGDRIILRDVNLVFKKGDFISIVGANGTGKSTLIKSTMRRELLLSGKMSRDSSLEFVGYVPQRHGLKSHFPISAFDVALMGTFRGCRFFSSPGEPEIEKTRAALSRVGLTGMEGKLYRELSGGQQQRILIARALVTGTSLLLLDEPCVGMDLPSEIETLELIKKLNSDEGISVVMVTHALDRARIASQVAILTGGSLVIGPGDEMLSNESLSHIYDIPASYFVNRREL